MCDTGYTPRDLVADLRDLKARGVPEAEMLEEVSAMVKRLLLMKHNWLRGSMQVPSVCEGAFPFGIQPQALEAVAPGYLALLSPRERYPQLRWRARR